MNNSLLHTAHLIYIHVHLGGFITCVRLFNHIMSSVLQWTYIDVWPKTHTDTQCCTLHWLQYLLLDKLTYLISINQSINQSMALSASSAGHTRTQSHAALYKIINEVVHSGMVASDYKRGSE